MPTIFFINTHNLLKITNISLLFRSLYIYIYIYILHIYVLYICIIYYIYIYNI